MGLEEQIVIQRHMSAKGISVDTSLLGVYFYNLKLLDRNKLNY